MSIDVNSKSLENCIHRVSQALGLEVEDIDMSGGNNIYVNLGVRYHGTMSPNDFSNNMNKLASDVADLIIAKTLLPLNIDMSEYHIDSEDVELDDMYYIEIDIDTKNTINFN